MKGWGKLAVAGVGAALLLGSCETASSGVSQAGSAPAAPVTVKREPPQELKDSGTVSMPAANENVEFKQAEAKPKAGTVSQIDLGTLFELQGDGRVLLVDVRPAFWYGAGHIPGAISLPLKSYDSEFPKRKPELDAAAGAGKAIVLYCTDEECPDGRLTARKLAKEGYSTSVYTGGWREWQASGL